MATEGKTEESGAPRFIQSTPYADRATALAVAMGVASALFHRERTGEGQRIDASLLQTAIDLMSRHVTREPTHDVVLRDPMLEQINRAASRAAGRTAKRWRSGTTSSRALRPSASTTAATTRSRARSCSER